MKTEGAVRLRPAALDDAVGIGSLCARNGMGPANPEDLREGWTTFPLSDEFRDIPIGWVLETDAGEVVGNLTNSHVLYEFQGKRLRGAVASAWAVDTEYRSRSLRLMTAFFRQPGIDLRLNVSANLTTARILTGMKIPRIPIPDYGTPCFWAVRPRRFAQAALLKKGVPGAAALAWPVGFALFCRDVLRRSGRGRLSSSLRRVERFDDRFDPLLKTIASGPPRLRAVRTRALLEWRFRGELRDGRLAIVVAERGRTPVGYALLVRRSGSDFGMDLYDVADIQAAGDEPATIRDLLLGSIGVAREDGVDAVKLLTGTPAKRLPAERLRPYTYTLPSWQQYFQASPELAAALATPDSWDFSLFDTF